MAMTGAYNESTTCPEFRLIVRHVRVYREDPDLDFFMEPIRTLLESKTVGASPVLSPELHRLYGGDLHFPEASENRPYVIGNFVATLDGVVSYQIPGKSGGGDISGHDDGDRFVMGLLRASADAVMIASGTLQATAPEHLWIPDSVSPIGTESYASYRRRDLGKSAMPLTVIVTASGAVDLDRAVFRTPGVRALIITTDRGRERLERSGVDRLDTTEVNAMAAPCNRIEPLSILRSLRAKYGVHLLLHEGGPTLFGQFVAHGLVDEFFLTVAPQIAGRTAERPRPGLIQGIDFLPETAPWLRIVSVKQRDDHLYLRYRSATAQCSKGDDVSA
jgi:riboflavin biosynthesis pyrimidine reductase